MKTMKYFWTLCLAVATFTFTACSDSDSSSSSSQMKIDQIYLENIDDDNIKETGSYCLSKFAVTFLARFGKKPYICRR